MGWNAVYIASTRVLLELAVLPIRIPEWLFPLINFKMKLILRTPLHVLFSSSLLLITFNGRRSGKQFTTPVRYMRHENLIYMFSSPSAQWWRNLEGGQHVTLKVKGHQLSGLAQVLPCDQEDRLELFATYLKRFPGDAVYHGLRIRRGKPLPMDLLKETLPHVSIVSFLPS